MYYNSYARIQKTQRLLERVAFVSVGSDIFIAVSTYLVLKNVQYSNSLLLLSDYVDFVFVAIAVALFLCVIMLRQASELPRRTNAFMFKVTHGRYHPAARLIIDRRHGGYGLIANLQRRLTWPAAAFISSFIS